jgi:hypothetical protein
MKLYGRGRKGYRRREVGDRNEKGYFWNCYFMFSYVYVSQNSLSREKRRILQKRQIKIIPKEMFPSLNGIQEKNILIRPIKAF